ncbi:hypothetical protein K432DRAFT_302780 [Lepidopterella palustris CBS 459.81]|uniref:ribonuclease Z n=1 Tax=Lepidopterella palustris CBS 459.81 TaxID=1314670 RepID=A0A8E2JD67_9PEZI|nr:hypothetical protein K432DRAFT_302780 [Lepidopterella palustris CBS 459.81]
MNPSQLQIITTPTVDTPGTTILLTTATKRYLFGNVSEGTQRAAVQVGARMGRLSELFITGRAEWSNLGGLVGMILTLADQNAASVAAAMESYNMKVEAGKRAEKPEISSRLNMHGPPNLNHTLGTCRRYVFRKGMPIEATEYKDEPPKKDQNGSIVPSWQDENIMVWSLAIAPEKDALETEAVEAEALAEQKAHREFENSNSFKDYPAPENETPEEREARYDRIRKATVQHMFDSNWRFDALVKKRLSEVEMPATIYVRNSETNNLEEYTGPMPGSAETVPDIPVLVRTPWPAALLKSLPPTQPATEATSYIVCSHSLRGKFNPKRATELEVEKVPFWRELTEGKSVKNKHGQIITPDMVLSETRPGNALAIVDLPSAAYVGPFLNREEWTSKDIMEKLRGFVWILGPGVASEPRLQEFMNKMDGVKHVVSSLDHCPNRLTFDSVATSTLRLAQIDPERYGVPFHDNVTVPQSVLDLSTNVKTSLPPNTIIADRGLTIDFSPNFRIKSEEILPRLDTAAALKGTPGDVLSLAKAAQDEIKNEKEAFDNWRNKITCPDAEIITLGTGSALPSKYRNVSATLLRVPGVGSYLFDCGEDTLGQLRRMYRPEEFVSVLRDLRMIWISHLHADHHLGTASVIKAWYSVVHNSIPSTHPPNIHPASDSTLEPTLAVVSHTGMLAWLHEYSSVEDFGYSRILPLSISDTIFRFNAPSILEIFPRPTTPTLEGYVVDKHHYPVLLGLKDIRAVSVQHCNGAKAVSITFPDFPSHSSASKLGPLKISYSGDCRPSKDFAVIGRGSTVLIHEATFDDELKVDAMAKKHSTTSEALGVGMKMGAKAVVLTHFSQRYQKIPVINTTQGDDGETVLLGDEIDAETESAAEAEATQADSAVGGDAMEGLDLTGQEPPQLKRMPTNEHIIGVSSWDMKVAVAFDYMKVKIGDIAKLEKFHPALNLLFAEGTEWNNGDKSRDGKGKKKGDQCEGGGKKKKTKRNN